MTEREPDLTELIEPFLAGTRALVCGSSQGIGRATAVALARRGAEVVLAARDKEKLAEVIESLARDDGQTHGYFVADFDDPESVRASAEKEIKGIGPFHILVNNTGGPPPGPIAAATTDQITAGLRQHLLVNQLLVQTLVGGMRKERYGRIINIISTSVKQPIAGLGVSNTVRGAVASWAKTLANELGPDGITVNNVLPGYTQTGRLETLIKKRAEEAGKSEEEISAAMLADVPIGRFGEPEETAAAIAFLASPMAGYITGVSLPVDGGRISCL